MKKAISLVLVVLLFSCNDGKKHIEKKENGGDEVYSVSDEDSDMNVAIDKAVKSYSDFLKVYESNDNNCSGFSVKMRFPYDGGGEHMWLSHLFLKNERLFGVLDSDPVNVFTVKAGDSLEVNKNRVSDWMFVKNGKLVGGYTIRVLYNKMSEKERADFRKEAGFDIE